MESQKRRKVETEENPDIEKPVGEPTTVTEEVSKPSLPTVQIISS